jgi:hypothetical protein
LTDARLASSLGQAGRARVQNTFLEEHFAVRFRRALAQLMPTVGDDEKDRNADALSLVSR